MPVTYLSHRPFLVIDTYHKPARGVRTERKGWASIQSNWTAAENPYVVDRITSKIIARSTVIIDLSKGLLVKNRYIESPAEDVIAHYLRTYGGQVEQAMSLFRTRQAKATETAATPSPEAVPA